MQMRPGVLQRVIQLTGSALLIASSLLLVWAFAVETYGTRAFTDLSRYGIYTALAGVVLHLLGGFGGRKPSV